MPQSITAVGHHHHHLAEQFDYTVEAVARGLQDRITVLFDDYRDLKGQFDKLVSIEMIEAVGHQFYDTYFEKISHLLKPHGKAVIQAITMTEQRYEQARDSVDFIKRYIFPGGCLPSLTVISDALSRVDRYANESPARYYPGLRRHAESLASTAFSISSIRSCDGL
jgi:cyclopropane fatty-acyl-phospholipid synthase-like methyltransferase